MYGSANTCSFVIVGLLAGAAIARADEWRDTWRGRMTFHASFDGSDDADHARGDARIYTAQNLELDQPLEGLRADAVQRRAGGRWGEALVFSDTTESVVFFYGKANVPHATEQWAMTISFWMRLDPDQDLKPGFADPLQITDKKWNDAALFVDFSKDERPRHFRLGVFADYPFWNPSDTPWDDIPEADRPMITVERPPFSRDEWTHVAITLERLNSQRPAAARLYLDGELQGEMVRPQRFTWDPDRLAIMLGLHYIGAIDDLAIFEGAMTADDITRLMKLEEGAKALSPSQSLSAAKHEPLFDADLVFPLHSQHNHAPGIVECPNGDLLVSWYRGSGERTADDVAVFGAWRPAGADRWSEPFLMADTPGFPDCNTCMWVDDQQRLWLFWPTVLANTWESCLTNYRVSSNFAAPAPPQWDQQGLILLKPSDFSSRAIELLEASLPENVNAADDGTEQRLEAFRRRLGDKLYQRLGWQPRCKPTILPTGRILLPLYTDTFSISIMAISDDGGQSWYASEPLIGFGNIQPTVLRRRDGTLVAYMRENGRHRQIRVAESSDGGLTWGPVGTIKLPNPGSGLDGIVLSSGAWLLVYNDTTQGRSSLAVSLSDDEGQSWKWTRHLEQHDEGAYHYPAVIQGQDQRIHAVYSYFVPEGKSMKYAVFNEAWVRQPAPQ
jgi:predicted neuraminidase